MPYHEENFNPDSILKSRTHQLFRYSPFLAKFSECLSNTARVPVERRGIDHIRTLHTWTGPARNRGQVLRCAQAGLIRRVPLDPPLGWPVGKTLRKNLTQFSATLRRIEKLTSQMSVSDLGQLKNKNENQTSEQHNILCVVLDMLFWNFVFEKTWKRFLNCVWFVCLTNTLKHKVWNTCLKHVSGKQWKRILMSSSNTSIWTNNETHEQHFDLVCVWNVCLIFCLKQWKLKQTVNNELCWQTRNNNADLFVDCCLKTKLENNVGNMFEQKQTNVEQTCWTCVCFVF